MTRSRASAKQAGQKFERLVADYLRDHVDPGIDIRPKNGRNDRGDIGGLHHLGRRIVVQCKDYGGVVHVGTWLADVNDQRGNDDAMVGVVVAKRRGSTDPGDQTVLMSLRDLLGLLIGERP